MVEQNDAARLRVVAVAGCLAALVAAADAPARDTLLRPGIGVGGVRLGMSAAQVRAALGPPRRVVRRSPNGYRDYVELVWGLSPELRVGLYGRGRFARVESVSTTRHERTRRGIGVGSTHRELQRGLRATCYRPPPPPGLTHWDHTGYPLQIACYVGARGGPSTAFHLSNDCQVPIDRYMLCPRSKRRYIAYEVVVMSPLGRRIQGAGDPRDGPWVPLG